MKSLNGFACILLTGLAGCIVVPLPSHTAPMTPQPILRRVGALSGRPQQVDFAAAVNPDCSSQGPVTYVLQGAPAHGTVAFRTAEKYLAFPVWNPRSRCNDRRLPASEVVYTSSPGFRGMDRFDATVLYPNGQFIETVFDVMVE